MTRTGLALFAVLLPGCHLVFGLEPVVDSDFSCVVDEDCVDGIREGSCRCGACSYPEPSCPVSNLRWDEAAEGELANACVPVAEQIDARVYHTCAAMTDGTAWCWGWNPDGQLGAGQPPEINSNLPIHVRASDGVVIDDIVEVRTGAATTCARRTDGSVICWGLNSSGQLGGGLAVERSIDPVPVLTASGPLLGATALAVGYRHGCAIVPEAGAADALYCWGLNNYGQLGDGTSEDRDRAAPVIGLPVGASLRKIVTAGEHTCVVTALGSAESQTYCWGRTGGGRLANNVGADSTQPIPQLAMWGDEMGIPSISNLATGNRHTCAIKWPPGEVFCWGPNGEGAIGDGTTLARALATRAQTPTGSHSLVAAGDQHSCVTLEADTYCWGGDASGQLGNGPAPTSLVPMRMIINDRLHDLTAGFEHTCALGTDRRLRCWGANVHGELGLGTTTNQDAPTEISASAFCPL